MSGRFCEFSELAQADLDEIASFIAADSSRAALIFIEELRRLYHSLAENSARYRLGEEYGAGLRVAVHNKYLIFYAECGDVVVIEHVLHASRRLDGLAL